MKSILKITMLIGVSLSLYACNSTQAESSEEREEEIIEVIEEPKETLSFEWAGEYYGVLPCADCEGIETLIELRNDLTYDKVLTYQTNDPLTIEDEGGIEWDEANRIITLISMNDTIFHQYKIEKAGMRALDMEGNKIEGDLTDSYFLNKK